MIIVCAACNKTVGKIASAAHPPDAITHGYCDECVFHLTAQMGIALEEFIEGLAAPVLVVDADGAVVTANALACDHVKKTLPEVKGKRGGEVFECAYAMLPEGCGQTIHCSGCAIRRTVMDTFRTGKAHVHQPATLNHGDPEQPSPAPLLISTEKVGDVVLLRIDRRGDDHAAETGMAETADTRADR